MKRLPYPVLLLAVACGEPSYSNDKPFGDDDTAGTSDGDTDTDADSDTDTDTDTDSDSDTDTDTDTDTDSDSDTDTDTDSDTDADICEHGWYATEFDGYERRYQVTLQGSAGTGEQSDAGTDYSGSTEVYVVYDRVDGGGNGWDGYVYVGCEYDGDDGMYLYEWDMNALFGGSAAGNGWAVIDPPRLVMPPEYDVGGVGSWNYADTATITIPSYSMTATADSTGTYLEEGTESVTLWDGSSYPAYVLSNTYSVTVDYGLGTQVMNGYLVQWYVEGLGLVREENTNTDDGSVLMTRELSGYSGLTP